MPRRVKPKPKGRCRPRRFSGTIRGKGVRGRVKGVVKGGRCRRR